MSKSSLGSRVRVVATFFGLRPKPKTLNLIPLNPKLQPGRRQVATVFIAALRVPAAAGNGCCGDLDEEMPWGLET